MAASSSHGAKEMFDLYDKTGQGSIELDALDHVVRSLNFNPTMQDLTNAKLQGDPTNTGYIDFATFQNILPILSTRPMNAADLTQCFQVFDRNDDGQVQITELAYAMTNLGNKVHGDSVDELVQEAQVPMSESKAPYAGFVKILVTPL